MSRFTDLIIDVEAAIEAGQMSFREIADEYKIPYEDVNLIAEALMETYDE